VSLPPGPHKNTAQHTVLGDRSTVVTLKPGQPLTVSVDFSAKSPSVKDTRGSPASPGF
jgi:hypothetical protein